MLDDLLARSFVGENVNITELAELIFRPESMAERIVLEMPCEHVVPGVEQFTRGVEPDPLDRAGRNTE